MSTTAKDAIIAEHNLCGDNRGCRCEDAEDKANSILSTAVTAADVELEVLRDAWRVWVNPFASDHSEADAEFDRILSAVRQNARSWASKTTLGHGDHQISDSDVAELSVAYYRYVAGSAKDAEGVDAAFDRIVDGIRAKAAYEAIAEMAGGKP